MIEINKKKLLADLYYLKGKLLKTNYIKIIDYLNFVYVIIISETIKDAMLVFILAEP